MRRTEELQWRWYLLAGVVTLGMILLLVLSVDRFSIVSHAESAAKVTASSANIRKEPNPSSVTIGSTEKDKVISIKSQVQGTDGYTWYEVYVDADTLGYIRSDLVQITDGTTPPTGTVVASSTTPSTSTTPSSAPAADVPDEPLVDVTAVNPASGSVTGGDSVRVRQNASTTSRILDRVKTGMALTITGTANGTDGKVWYQVTYVNSGGTEVTGFIRNDYTTVKPDELTPYTEEPSAEEPPADTEEPSAGAEEPAPEGTTGYGAVLQNGQWWLVDYEGKHSEAPGQGFQIEEMFNAVKQNKTLLDESEKTVKTQKLLLIILVILLVGAAAAVTLLIFKVKDMADAQYFNEVEKDTLKRRGTKPQGSGQRVMQTVGGDKQGGKPAGNQGSRPAGSQGGRPAGSQGSRPAGSQGSRPAGSQGSRPAGTSQGQRPQGGKTAGAPQGARPAGSQGQQGQPRSTSQGAKPSDASQGQQRPAAQGQRPQGNRPAQNQQSPGWQSKNFMADEDEFEFEFLNYEGDDEK